MSDQCRCCIVRGDYKKCLSTPCYHHENWINKQRIKKISEARADALRMAKPLELGGRCIAGMSRIELRDIVTMACDMANEIIAKYEEK